MPKKSSISCRDIFCGLEFRKKNRSNDPKETSECFAPGVTGSPVVATLAVAATASVVVGVSGGY